jgi:TPR repeat protein
MFLRNFAFERLLFALLALPGLALAAGRLLPSAVLAPAAGRLVCPQEVDYPRFAYASNATGRSILRARVTPDGVLHDIHLVRPVGHTITYYGLDDAAQAHAALCRVAFGRDYKVPRDLTTILRFDWRIDGMPFESIEADQAALDGLHRDARAGDVEAAWSIFERTAWREDTVPDAIHWLRVAADHDHAIAKYWLGLLYLHGEGVARDPAQTAALWQAAADHGQVYATRALVTASLDASGPLHDPARALALLQHAATFRDSWAWIRLGDVEAAGEITPRDDQAAVELWRKAWLRDRAGQALLRLSWAHAQGRGVRQDRILAGMYATLAKRSHVLGADDALAALRLDAQEADKATVAAQAWREGDQKTLPE